MDDDLTGMTRESLVAEVKRLRNAIREHRDSSGHDLCWHHPQLWGLLPEPMPTDLAVPPWPKFLRGCLRYRESLERELPNARRHEQEYAAPRAAHRRSLHDPVTSIKRASCRRLAGLAFNVADGASSGVRPPTGDDPMRKLTMALVTTAAVAFSGAAIACPYGAATSADISTPTQTAEAPISKPAQN